MAIRTKVFRICRSLRLSRDDGEDLEQQIRLELVTRASKFDPARGTWEAFVTTVTENRARTHFRRLRKLPKPMPFSEMASALDRQPDFPLDARLRHRGTEPRRTDGDMRLDVAFVQDQLDLDAQIMTDMLRVFSVSDISSRTKVPLSTMYERVKKLRRPFRGLIAWPERFNQDELSAIQHAMNLRLQDEGAFMAEYQNEPLIAAGPGSDLLSADHITGKINRIPRTIVPHDATRLTAFIDVHQNLLFYVVCAWEEDFTGSVIDYGAWPDPQRPYFTLRDATQTLSTMAPGTGLEVPVGDHGCLTLYGDAPARHRLFAEHLTAEYRVHTSGRGRTVDEWKMRPEQSDNHWLDGLVGCAVGASIQGISLLGEKPRGGRAVRTFVIPERMRGR